MRLCGVIVSLAFSLVPAIVWAQVPEETETRRVRAQRIPDGDAIRIDGHPDEPFWQQIEPATDFLQREPNTGSAATERTEVRVAYDAERLILGGRSVTTASPTRLLGQPDAARPVVRVRRPIRVVARHVSRRPAGISSKSTRPARWAMASSIPRPEGGE